MSHHRATALSFPPSPPSQDSFSPTESYRPRPYDGHPRGPRHPSFAMSRAITEMDYPDEDAYIRIPPAVPQPTPVRMPEPEPVIIPPPQQRQPERTGGRGRFIGGFVRGLKNTLPRWKKNKKAEEEVEILETNEGSVYTADPDPYAKPPPVNIPKIYINDEGRYSMTDHRPVIPGEGRDVLSESSASLPTSPEAMPRASPLHSRSRSHPARSHRSDSPERSVANSHHSGSHHPAHQSPEYQHHRRSISVSYHSASHPAMSPPSRSSSHSSGTESPPMPPKTPSDTSERMIPTQPIPFPVITPQGHADDDDDDAASPKLRRRANTTTDHFTKVVTDAVSMPWKSKRVTVAYTPPAPHPDKGAHSWYSKPGTTPHYPVMTLPPRTRNQSQPHYQPQPYPHMNPGQQPIPIILPPHPHAIGGGPPPPIIYPAATFQNPNQPGVYPIIFSYDGPPQVFLPPQPHSRKHSHDPGFPPVPIPPPSLPVHTPGHYAGPQVAIPVQSPTSTRGPSIRFAPGVGSEGDDSDRGFVPKVHVERPSPNRASWYSAGKRSSK